MDAGFRWRGQDVWGGVNTLQSGGAKAVAGPHAEAPSQTASRGTGFFLFEVGRVLALPLLQLPTGHDHNLFHGHPLVRPKRLHLLDELEVANHFPKCNMPVIEIS